MVTGGVGDGVGTISSSVCDGRSDETAGEEDVSPLGLGVPSSALPLSSELSNGCINQSSSENRAGVAAGARGRLGALM